MRVSICARTSRNWAAGLCLVLVAAAGCGGKTRKTGDVSGSVVVNGTPLAAGFVNFEDQAHGVGVSATVKEGAYKFEAPLDIGDYKVYVQPPSLVPSSATATGPETKGIPIKYLYAGSSPLKATVVEGPNKFEFKLDKK